MRHPALKWTVIENSGRDPLHQWHTAKDAIGTVYKIRPVYYSGRRGKSGGFAGYRIQVGDMQIRGYKTMLIDAKASAQRFANRANSVVLQKRERAKRTLDLSDTTTMEIEIPKATARLILDFT